MTWRFNPQYPVRPALSAAPPAHEIWRHVLAAEPTTIFIETRVSGGGARKRYRCITQEQYERETREIYDHFFECLPPLHELLPSFDELLSERDTFVTWPAYARVQEPRRVFLLGPSTEIP